MVCLNPITAWKRNCASLTESPQDYYKHKKLKFKKPTDIEHYEQIKISCGHCLGCRLDHANTWATRIMLESKRHKDNCFLTLTYKPEKLPTNNGKMSLRKKDFQDFIKRLRYHLKTKISYFGCGEYGPNTYRPHYHIIIFGWKPNDLKEIFMSNTQNAMFTSKKLEDIWGNGFIVVQDLNYKTACYTARYVQKKAGINPVKRISTNEPEFKVKIDERNGKQYLYTGTKYIQEKNDIFGREKEFILMSKKPAIGLTYWQENKEKIKNNGIMLKIDKNVQIKPISRYFKKQWEKEAMSEYDTWCYHKKQEFAENHKKLLEKYDGNDPEKIYLDTMKSKLENNAKYLKRNQN